MKIYKKAELPSRYEDVWEELNDMYDMEFEDTRDEERQVEVEEWPTGDWENDPRHRKEWGPNGGREETMFPGIASKIASLEVKLRGKDIDERERKIIKQELSRLQSMHGKVWRKFKEEYTNDIDNEIYHENIQIGE